MPFNNFTTLPKRRGVDIPEGMGGNCFDHVERLQADFRKAGHEALVASLVFGNHVGLVAKEAGGKKYLIDTSLGHLAPMPITYLDEETRQVAPLEAEGIDLREKISVVSAPENCLPVNWSYEKEGGIARVLWKACFNLADEVLSESVSPKDKIASAGYPSAHLTICVPEIEKRTRWVLQRSLSDGVFSIASASRGVVREDVDPDKFGERFDHVTKLINISAERVRAIFDAVFYDALEFREFSND